MWTGFTTESFELLDRFKENDDPEGNYKKEEYDPLIRNQFKAIKDKIFPLLSELLPEYDLTDLYALAKHSSRGNRLYHHFWAALYRKSKESNKKDIQFFWRIDPDRFSFGLYVGHECDSGIFNDIQNNVQRNGKELLKVIDQIKIPRALTFANDDTHGFLQDKLTPEEALDVSNWAEGKYSNIYFNYSRDEVIQKGVGLLDEMIEGFRNLSLLYRLIVSPFSVANTEVKVAHMAKKLSVNEKPVLHKNYSTNTILYGAPGTGKTYNAKRHAVEIVTGKPTTSVFLEEYEVYVASGDISFVTFHPNFGYENFVEGIFPDTDAPGGLRYVAQDGIFKNIVAKALKELLIPTRSDSGFLSFEDAYDKFLDLINEKGGALELTTTKQGKSFSVSESETGGLVFTVTSGNVFHCAVKKLKRIYDSLVKRNIDKPERLDVLEDKSLRAYTVVVLRKILELAKDKKIDNSKNIDVHDPFELLESQNYTINQNPKRFVVVIDEINRGNIPSIFGELITLIEETKRIGSPEQTIVTLPISKSKFGVPSNLHILGTMNTADRSVEALDVALRRRFDFKEMVPEYSDSQMISPVEGIDLLKMLKCINDRVAVLKGRDYVIGHSYFIGIKSASHLRYIFKNRVIPLLEEYFFGEMNKVKLVLGKAFVRSKYTSADLIKLKLANEIDISEILEVTHPDDWDFKSIYE